MNKRIKKNLLHSYQLSGLKHPSMQLQDSLALLKMVAQIVKLVHTILKDSYVISILTFNTMEEAHSNSLGIITMQIFLRNSTEMTGLYRIQHFLTQTLLSAGLALCGSGWLNTNTVVGVFHRQLGQLMTHVNWNALMDLKSVVMLLVLLHTGWLRGKTVHMQLSSEKEGWEKSLI